MANLLKKYFIPSHINEYQPYSLRKKAVLALLLFVLLLEGFFLIQILFVFRYTNIFSSILPDVLIDLANSDRQKNDVGGLIPNPLLEKAAQLKALDMAQNGYFAHTSPSGVTPWYWLQKVGYQYSGAGENLAVNFSDSADIENAWMNSPSHRKNILDNRFSEIGIAAVKGNYKGQETIFVVQFFGRPLVAVAQTAETSEPANSSGVTPSKKQEVTVSSPQAPTQEMAIIKQPELPATVSGAQTQNSPSEESKPAAQSSIFERIFVTPKIVSNAIYIFLAAFIILALVLKIFIKIRIQYPKLIFNGVLVLFVVISILYLNYLVIQPGQIF